MQAHRPWLPRVDDVVGFAAVAAAGGVALAHPDGGALTSGIHTLLVGPEGGWSAAEEAAVAGRVRLGPHVLRAATAATVAGALLVGARRVRQNDTERG
jgi:RsmE family RNA methyltransferase